MRVTLEPELKSKNIAAHQAQAKDVCDKIPTLLLAARRLAATQLSGIHGRRRAGVGENFWQYRRYSDGEPAVRIDWRHSARSTHYFVREKEWQASHTVWFDIDLSPSMHLRSDLTNYSKLESALILLFALSEKLVDMNERAGLLGITPALSSKMIAQRFAEALLQNNMPPANVPASRFSDCIVISDFLTPVENIFERCRQLSQDGAKLHLVQILDPYEESFPFSGRIKLIDPETQQDVIVENANSITRQYKWALENHKTLLRQEARFRGWSFHIHHTHKSLALLCLKLLQQLNISEQVARVT